MANWLHQNLTLVVGWLVTFLSSVVTSVLLAPVVSHRLRRGAESRDAHLAELKEQLLRPMLEYLNDHMVPILDQRLGNVGIRAGDIRESTAGVLQSPTMYAEEFCFREATRPPIDAYLDFREGATTPPHFEGALFDDAHAHHFRTLIATWKDLLSSFDKYDTACISYVERLKSEVAGASSLPQHALTLPGPPWIHASPLALIVFYRQLGLDPGQFSRVPVAEQNMEGLAYQTSHWFAQGHPDEIAKIITMLDNLILRRETMERLTADADRVKGDALWVKQEIDRLLLVRRLSGRCPYLA